jgi:hypothetical protein
MKPVTTVLVALAMLSVVSSEGIGQSPTAIRNVPAKRRAGPADTTAALRAQVDTAQAKAAASRNPYVGAQIGYAFGDGEFASNLVTSGSFLYEIDVGQSDAGAPVYGFPIRGNIGPILAAGLDNTEDAAKEAREKAIQDLVVSAQGIRIAMEPWRQIYGGDDKFFRSTIFASLGWKLNAVKDPTDTTRYLAAGRVSGGIDLGVGRTKDGRLPILVTLSPVYSVFANQDYKKIEGLKKQYASGELTIVVPVASNVALLTEGIVASGRSPIWRIGLLTVAASDRNSQ